MTSTEVYNHFQNIHRSTVSSIDMAMEECIQGLRSCRWVPGAVMAGLPGNWEVYTGGLVEAGVRGAMLGLWDKHQPGGADCMDVT